MPEYSYGRRLDEEPGLRCCRETIPEMLPAGPTARSHVQQCEARGVDEEEIQKELYDEDLQYLVQDYNRLEAEEESRRRKAFEERQRRLDLKHRVDFNIDGNEGHRKFKQDNSKRVRVRETRGANDRDIGDTEDVKGKGREFPKLQRLHERESSLGETAMTASSQLMYLQGTAMGLDLRLRPRSWTGSTDSGSLGLTGLNRTNTRSWNSPATPAIKHPVVRDARHAPAASVSTSWVGQLMMRVEMGEQRPAAPGPVVHDEIPKRRVRERSVARPATARPAASSYRPSTSSMVVRENEDRGNVVASDSADETPRRSSSCILAVSPVETAALPKLASSRGQLPPSRNFTVSPEDPRSPPPRGFTVSPEESRHSQAASQSLVRKRRARPSSALPRPPSAWKPQRVVLREDNDDPQLPPPRNFTGSPEESRRSHAASQINARMRRSTATSAIPLLPSTFQPKRAVSPEDNRELQRPLPRIFTRSPEDRWRVHDASRPQARKRRPRASSALFEPSATWLPRKVLTRYPPKAPGQLRRILKMGHRVAESLTCLQHLGEGLTTRNG